jgi:hypothetical protein
VEGPRADRRESEATVKRERVFFRNFARLMMVFITSMWITSPVLMPWEKLPWWAFLGWLLATLVGLALIITLS